MLCFLSRNSLRWASVNSPSWHNDIQQAVQPCPVPSRAPACASESIVPLSGTCGGRSRAAAGPFTGTVDSRTGVACSAAAISSTGGSCGSPGSTSSVGAHSVALNSRLECLVCAPRESSPPPPTAAVGCEGGVPRPLFPPRLLRGGLPGSARSIGSDVNTPPSVNGSDTRTCASESVGTNDTSAAVLFGTAG